MFSTLKDKIIRVAGRSPLGRVPVRVRAGLAQGARWTLFPHSGYWRGTFERDVDAALARVGRLKAAGCWDLGTHFGIYTVGLGRAVGPDGQVVGFEPDPVSFARCQLHVRMNGLSWVRLYRAAASDASGTSEILTYSGFGQTTTHLRYPGEQGVGSTGRPVETIAPDDLVARGEFRPPRLIKIDVEGHGGPALEGMRRTIAAHRPHLLMSFHCPSEVRAARTLVGREAYRWRDCQSGGDAAAPADDYFGTLHLDPEPAVR